MIVTALDVVAVQKSPFFAGRAGSPVDAVATCLALFREVPPTQG